MNITPLTNVSIATVVNPQADTLRRENNQREVIAQPAAASQSAAEKGVASERERAKNPGQNNEKLDFDNLRKQAELANGIISEQDKNDNSQQQSSQQDTNNTDPADQENSTTEDQKVNGQFADMSSSEKKEIQVLQQRDREVRAHETAHAAAGGSVTGSPSYTFEVGPDGKKYAVEGEVSVDLSTVPGDPRATIVKMQKVYNAALAPANPSIQDSRVANTAAQIIAQAQSELLAINFDRSPLNPATNNTTEVEQNFTAENENALQANNSDFDKTMDQTLLSQQRQVTSRGADVEQRAGRIENFYLDINQAYQKPPTFQFELTA
jgi:hypothetical protein